MGGSHTCGLAGHFCCCTRNLLPFRASCGLENLLVLTCCLIRAYKRWPTASPLEQSRGTTKGRKHEFHGRQGAWLQTWVRRGRLCPKRGVLVGKAQLCKRANAMRVRVQRSSLAGHRQEGAPAKAGPGDYRPFKGSLLHAQPPGPGAACLLLCCCIRVLVRTDIPTCMQYECRLCLTLHNNEGNYLAHTQVLLAWQMPQQALPERHWCQAHATCRASGTSKTWPSVPPERLLRSQWPQHHRNEAWSRTQVFAAARTYPGMETSAAELQCLAQSRSGGRATG